MKPYPAPPSGGAVRQSLNEALNFFTQLHCGLESFRELRHADQIALLDSYRRECVAEVTRLTQERRRELERADRQAVRQGDSV